MDDAGRDVSFADAASFGPGVTGAVTRDRRDDPVRSETNISPTSATMFATTLRSRRARQKSALPPLRWLPRMGAGRAGMEKLIGAQVDMSQLWLAIPRRTVRRSRRKPLEQQQREFDLELLQVACTQAASWPDGMRLMVSLEDDQAPDTAFNGRLNSVLDQSGFPISRLDLVFQESGIAQEEREVCYTLASLRDRGVQIFTNGFGSSVSSLTLLRERAVSGLLDGVQFDLAVLSASTLSWSLQGSVPELDEGAVVFYRAALEAVKALGLCIRATGVDTPKQLEFVQKTGCSEASGLILAGAETTAQITERFASVDGRSRRRRMTRTAEGL
ncbi:EAL domain-containing protein [Gluconobacter cerinus]|uniref:EAL domain-containing protein n=1 Tax=Gluconobacter cerinus TaxID=38307 RepID=UPI002012DE4F|nr:EAL domain-containing protein [Gluconobacter cerinus]